MVGRSIFTNIGTGVSFFHIPSLMLEVGRPPIHEVETTISLTSFEEVLGSLVIKVIEATALEYFVGINNFIATFSDFLFEQGD